MRTAINLYNNKQDEPSALSVAKDYIITPSGIQNMVIRPVVHALKFTELVATALAGTVKGPREVFRLADHLLYWVGYPSRLKNFDKSARKLKDSLTSGSLYKISTKVSKLYIDSSLVIGLIADGVKNLHTKEVIHLSSPYVAVLEQISFMGSIAFLLLALHSIKKQVKKLTHNEAWSPQFNLALITLIGKICLAVLAVFGIIAFFNAPLISPWLTLAFAVGLLVCSVTGHFYGKIHVPQQPKSVALLPQKSV